MYLVAPRWQEIPGSTDHSVPLAALATAQFIMPNQTHTVRRSLEQAFAHAGLTLDVVVELDHTRPLAEAVELGLGMTVLPKAAAESMFPRDAVRLYRIVDPSLVTALALATPDGQPLSLAAEAALEVVRAAVLHRLGRA
ncbi:LysR substrate-binding domain-containing protein [Curtobacterium flaccumfaciens]|nr:LysR substrate-binding domain-containing protein [Curtobacterium flaccumfaciens]